ncbi:MAG: BlaI/MecI/CopY family transcriptional regulator [Eubacteriales bacterium]|nr:BlaI/MecI/CopY family transcriptional regulator [Eubacteriales bacterium]
MEEKKKLPDAELAVMQAIWTHSGEVARSDIETALSDHNWTANTINTYLTRLCEKGFLSVRREGRGNLYTAQVTRETYLKYDSQETLGKLYGGSVKRFVAALCAEKPLEQSEIDELRRYLDELSR